MTNFKAGDKVILTTRCLGSGMNQGITGTLVYKCGHKRGNSLHFHKDGLWAPHAERGVCRNQNKWQLAEEKPYHFWRRVGNFIIYQAWVDCTHERWQPVDWDTWGCANCGVIM